MAESNSRVLPQTAPLNKQTIVYRLDSRIIYGFRKDLSDIRTSVDLLREILARSLGGDL